MKRGAPWEQSYTISDSSDSNSDSDEDVLGSKKNTKKIKNGGSRSSKGIMSEDALIRRAKMYQEYMKHLPLPNHRGSLIPFISWQGLAKSMKLLYNQPLHYLTNTLIIQWDRARIGSENENEPLDSIVYPVKAEAVIWVIEEVHRLTSSHHHLAKLWASQPLFEAYIDPIFPSTKKQGGMNYEALNRHGYHGGPSILNVPPPRVDDNDKDWSWSKGKRDGKEDALEESYEERERTRAISKGEKLLTVQSSLPVEKKEKNVSFSQKEKRKRDLGQASRGKNYVEEEKRLLRDSGIYSGFDS